MTGAGCAIQRELIRAMRDDDAGQVADVLAERQLAVDVQPGQRLELVELLDQQLRALHVFLGVLRRPPVAQHAVGVEAAALIVEAVAHLVADHARQWRRSSPRRRPRD